MSTARRMSLGGVLALVAGGLLLAGAGSVLAATGLDLPAPAAHAISAAGDVLLVLRVLLIAALALSVAGTREDS